VGKGAQMLIGATAVALLIGWYGWSQVEEGAFTYYKTLGEFQTAGAVGVPVRVHGYVVDGTIERDVAGKQVSFAVQELAPHAGGSAEGAMPVVYASLEVPDLFKDGAEVVVEGKLASNGSFEATNLLAKCPSKFEAAQEEGATRPPAG
jgi:cytochrome c-type biogenesis protein CcmE